MRIHHIGYAVNDILNAIQYFESLGYIKDGDICYDMIRNISIQFMREVQNGGLVELVAPMPGENSIVDILKRNGGCSMPYHMCYECDDGLDEAIDKLRKSGFILLKNPQEAPAIAGRRVAFLFAKEAGIVELLEYSR